MESDLNRTPDNAPVTVVLLGWGGANERQMNSYTKLYCSQNIEAIVFVLPIPALLNGNKVNAALKTLTEQLSARRGFFIVHAFSNMGFGTLSSILHFETEKAISSRILGVIFDSGPGFKNPTTALSYAGDLKRATSSTLSNSFTGKVWLNKAVSLVAGGVSWVHYHAFPSIGQHYCSATERFFDSAPDTPVLLLVGVHDQVIPLERTREFATRLRQAGWFVESVEFEYSDHIVHYRYHREQYTEAVETFVHKVLASRRALSRIAAQN